MFPCIKLLRVTINVLHCLSHDASLDMSFSQNPEPFALADHNSFHRLTSKHVLS